MIDANPIRAKRKALSLSQADLAAMLGVDQAAISRAENAEQPDARYVLALDGIAATRLTPTDQSEARAAA